MPEILLMLLLMMMVVVVVVMMMMMMTVMSSGDRFLPEFLLLKLTIVTMRLCLSENPLG